MLDVPGIGSMTGEWFSSQAGQTWVGVAFGSAATAATSARSPALSRATVRQGRNAMPVDASDVPDAAQAPNPLV